MQTQVPTKKDLRQEVAPQAARRRKMYRTAIWLGLGACVIFPGALFGPLALRVASGVLFLAGIFGAIIGVALTRIRCPGCAKVQGNSLEKFCPWCGSEPLQKEGMVFEKMTCRSCQKVYRRGKNGYSYKTRYCTCCGSFLDDDGV